MSEDHIKALHPTMQNDWPPLPDSSPPGATLLECIAAHERVVSHGLKVDMPRESVEALQREALSEFELLEGAKGAGHKLYSRSQFLAPDDPRGASEADFYFRLAQLFGGPSSVYVLRHRPTNIVVYAYSAQSGPAYGGAERLVTEEGEPPDANENVSGTPFRWEPMGDLCDRMRGLQSDPILSRSPIDWDQHEGASLQQRRALREIEREHQLRQADALAPEGVPAVVRRLDKLLMSLRVPG